MEMLLSLDFSTLMTLAVALNSMYSVYIHIVPNGMVYIGETSQNPKRRWKNGSGYFQQTEFYKAILYYGWNNIEHKVLATFLDKNDALDYEIKLIQEYKDQCYNIKCKSTTANAQTCRARYRAGLK